MRRAVWICVTTVCASGLLHAQAPHMPQTARQALIEMLSGKTPGSLEKHLPEATRAAIRKADPASGATMLQNFSMFTGRLTASGQQFQTFDAGPTLLSVEDQHTNSKFEAVVERDDLRGEEDEIELSFHAYKNGQPQNLEISPRLTLTMKQEAQVWRLNDIMFSIKLSLSDPEFLKAISQARPGLATASASPASPVQASVVAAMRTILTAETTYASTYATRGYTCSLSDLDGFGADEANESHAMLIDTRLASGKKFGYIFSLSACHGTPSQTFRLTAIPSGGPGTGRAYCADHNAIIRYSDDGTAASCWGFGKRLQ